MHRKIIDKELIRDCGKTKPDSTTTMPIDFSIMSDDTVHSYISCCLKDKNCFVGKSEKLVNLFFGLRNIY